MSINVMIIDGFAEFRDLLSHHITTEWRDARVSTYDPDKSGYLPDEFSGAGNDIIFLGDKYGDRDALDTLTKFTSVKHFPPIIYFGSSAGDKLEAFKRFADGFLVRDEFSHRELIILVDDLLQSQRRVSATDSLFVGDLHSGVHPSIKGYRFINRLSVNPHSAVFLAESEATRKQLVLKILRHVPDRSDETGPFERFLEEYEIIADIDHPNIVKIHDLTVADDHMHIAMEYLAGGTLQQQIRAGVSEDQAVNYLIQIASALDKLHSFGITHRDLKPANIMLRDDGTVALIDFGLAKRMRMEQDSSKGNEIFGTPYYMSPEQGKGKGVDKRSDIYSLGVVFYEMLTGDRPYYANNAMEIIYKHCEDPVPVLPHRLSKYQALLNMLMAKDPANRLKTAGEVTEWLR
jgi:serine/threonine protein kinase